MSCSSAAATATRASPSVSQRPVGVASDVVDRQASQVHDAERVLEARMPGAGPDARDEPELLDALESNERGRADQGEIRSAERNAIVQGVADGRFDRNPVAGAVRGSIMARRIVRS